MTAFSERINGWTPQTAFPTISNSTTGSGFLYPFMKAYGHLTIALYAAHNNNLASAMAEVAEAAAHINVEMRNPPFLSDTASILINAFRDRYAEFVSEPLDEEPLKENLLAMVGLFTRMFAVLDWELSGATVTTDTRL